MNRPVNFETIDGSDFEIHNQHCYFDFDSMIDKQKHSRVWIFCNGGMFGDYCVMFDLKWEHNCYSMKRCVLGEGETGDWIFQDNYISNEWIKTKDKFASHIIDVVKKAVELKKFEN